MKEEELEEKNLWKIGFFILWAIYCITFFIKYFIEYLNISK